MNFLVDLQERYERLASCGDTDPEVANLLRPLVGGLHDALIILHTVQTENSDLYQQLKMTQQQVKILTTAVTDADIEVNWPPDIPVPCGCHKRKRVDPTHEALV